MTIQKNQEEDQEGDFAMNFSQTGTTSEEQITPPDQVRSASERAAGNNIAVPPTGQAAEMISLKKLSREQLSTEHAESTDRKTTKGFRGAALSKFGHWSKNAFNFFRTKNTASGMF